MKVVIMAGGKGTRIQALANDIPKPMIKIQGKPILEYEIECLREQGFKDIIITVSHLGNIIMDYFGDGSRVSPVTGRPFDVNIKYFVEDAPLGNAGALFMLTDELTEDFLLINGDMVFDVDLKRFIEFHVNNGGKATLFVHPNSHPYDSGLLIIDDEHRVVRWLTKEDERPKWYKNCINAGLHIVSPEILGSGYPGGKVDLDRQILKPLTEQRKVYAYNSPEYVKDMGTLERYEAVCRDYAEGRVSGKSLRYKQKAIFLDRDGTINRYVGFLRKEDDFELLSGVAEAIKKINESGYLAIVVTNQPVIARGEMTKEGLEEIHNKMETLLGKEGAYLDAVYFCPHHPDSGFEGEVKSLKIECECRKPKPGLLIRASKEWNIDLSESWIVGDGRNDILAGKRANCKTALIGTDDYGQDITITSLFDFANRVL